MNSEARDIGLDLLVATSRLDGPIGISHGVGGADYTALAFAVRGRRLLRGAYLLLDADLPEAANALFRVMSEYMMVGHWVTKAGDERTRAWALNDLRERRTVLLELLADDKIAPPNKTSLRAELRATEDAIRTYGGPAASLTKRGARKAGEPPVPNLHDMAKEIGLNFAYSFGYRLQSQTDVHATPLAIDAVYEDVVEPGDPGPKVRRAPRHALDGLDLYAAGAHVMIDILRIVDSRFDEIEWSAMLDEFTQRLRDTSEG